MNLPKVSKKMEDEVKRMLSREDPFHGIYMVYDMYGPPDVDEKEEEVPTSTET